MKKVVFKEQASQFYEILKKDKKVTLNNYKKLSDIIVCVAKKDLKISDVVVEFSNFNKNNGGFSDNHYVCINKKNVKTLSMQRLINTLFHEIRHVYQQENPNYKQFNKPLSLPFRPKNVNENTFVFINKNNIGINPFSLYVVATEEFDARNYASNMTQKFLFDLKEIAKNDKNFYIKFLIDLQIYLSIKRAKTEQDKFNNALKYLNKNKKVVGKNSYYFIKDNFKEIESNDKNTRASFTNDNWFVTKIKAITNFYYDENIEKLLLDKSYSTNNPYILSCSVNSLFSKTSEKIFDDCIKMFIQNGSNLKEIKKNLSNWDEKLIEQEFYTSKQTTKNPIKL